MRPNKNVVKLKKAEIIVLKNFPTFICMSISYHRIILSNCCYIMNEFSISFFIYCHCLVRREEKMRWKAFISLVSDDEEKENWKEFSFAVVRKQKTKRKFRKFSISNQARLLRKERKRKSWFPPSSFSIETTNDWDFHEKQKILDKNSATKNKRK